MPWRKPSDVYKAKYFSKLKEGEFYDDKTTSFDQAYGALVSELMLQQTQYVYTPFTLQNTQEYLTSHF